MVGSDGVPGFGTYSFHPRWTGTFPRILGYYVRELGLISLEEAIRKMTSLPAGRLGIRRGLIKEDFWADITIFDPENIKDTATWEDPYQYPKGVEYVIVNGVVVVDEMEHTCALPGISLRGKGYKIVSAK